MAIHVNMIAATLALTDFYVRLYGRRCSTLIATGPVPRRATVAIRYIVKHAKGDDLKQIVELPPRFEHAVRRID